MSFLAPAFLAGILALGVPVFIHLTHRTSGKVVPFPSLMFLEQVPFRTMRRQRIRHWALLALRCLALVLLALAFARPFIDQPQVAAALGAESREVVILLDRSFSMRHGDRWDRAVDAARDAVASLGTGDRASLVLFAEGAQLAARPTSEAAALLPLIDSASPGHGTTRYAPALKMAQQILAESEMPGREVVLITDYQRSGWSAEDDVQLPEGTVLTGIDAAAEDDPSNVAVTDVLVQRQFAGDRELLSLAARVINQGAEPLAGLQVSLEVDGEVIQGRAVDLDADSAVTVSFDAIPVEDVTVRGTVRAGSDELAADNEFHFVFEPGRAVPVLVVVAPRAGATDSFFLERALEIGSRPAFRVRRVARDAVTADDIAAASVVFLVDTAAPSGAAGAALVQHVEEGGGLVVALGELVDPTAWQSGAAATLVPPFPETVDRNEDLGGTLASFETSHPVFEVFGAPRSGDFTTASFYRYRRLEPAPDDRVLAELDDGSPALVERPLGEGRVLVWPTTLDRFWNDLVTQPVFLPFVHQLARHAAAYRERNPWYRVGQPLAVADLGADDADEGSVRIAPLGVEPGDTGEAAVPTVTAPGFWEVSWSAGDADGGAIIAANLDPSESDLSRLDAEELEAAVQWRGTGPLEADAALGTAADREGRQSFWWYLLVLAFGLLAAETLVSNRMAPLAR